MFKSTLCGMQKEIEALWCGSHSKTTHNNALQESKVNVTHPKMAHAIGHEGERNANDRHQTHNHA